jgi:hypothetical protein
MDAAYTALWSCVHEHIGTVHVCPKHRLATELQIGAELMHCGYCGQMGATVVPHIDSIEEMANA